MATNGQKPTWDWADRAAAFIRTKPEDWVAQMAVQHKERHPGQEPDEALVLVWLETYHVLRRTLIRAGEYDHAVFECLLVVRFAFPDKPERTVDLIMLTGTGHLFVVNLIQETTVSPADYERVESALADLVANHSHCQNLLTYPMLAMIRGWGDQPVESVHGGVLVDAPVDWALVVLSDLLWQSCSDSYTVVRPLDWLTGTYAPGGGGA